MSRDKDYTGQTFHYLTIIKVTGKRRYHYENHPDAVFREVLCRCKCGNEKIILLPSILSGNTKSCGCLNKENGEKRRKYDFTTTYNGKDTLKRDTYKIWAMMKGRCLNPNSKVYKWYGGRGIKVCERWLDFKNFRDDMGYKPEGEYSIDRIDNNGDYCPENCRWVTVDIQANNKQNSVRIKYEGKQYSIKQLATMFNMKPRTLSSRLFEYGWKLEIALNSPVSKRLKGRNKL